MIRLIKDRKGHNAFINFGDLSDEQVSELLTIAKGKSRATMPSVTFPEGSEETVDPYTTLVKPKRFFSNGDLSVPKVLAFKVLGDEILTAIGAAAEKDIAERLAKIEAGEAKALAQAKEDLGEDCDPDDYRDTHARGKLADKQEVLDTFRKAIKLL